MDSQEIDITYASYNGRLSEQRIVICDSPGINYSGELKHMQITDQMISSESYQMIIYLTNATQLGTTMTKYIWQRFKSMIEKRPFCLS